MFGKAVLGAELLAALLTGPVGPLPPPLLQLRDRRYSLRHHAAIQLLFLFLLPLTLLLLPLLPVVTIEGSLVHLWADPEPKGLSLIKIISADISLAIKYR
jgi:hypothetical protein